MWRAIARDADTRLNTREGALEWLKEFAPELWVAVGNKTWAKKREEPVHGWRFGTNEWLRFRSGVEAVKGIAAAREDGRRAPEAARLTARAHIARHLRHEPAPSADPTDAAPGLMPYFVRCGAGRSGAEVVSAVNEGQFDSPDVLIAYALASMFKPDVVPHFGGRCPVCRRLTGETPKGKPRVGMCGKCKMALWRAENPDKAEQQRAAALRTRKRKAAKKVQTTNVKGE